MVQENERKNTNYLLIFLALFAIVILFGQTYHMEHEKMAVHPKTRALIEQNPSKKVSNLKIIEKNSRDETKNLVLL